MTQAFQERCGLLRGLQTLAVKGRALQHFRGEADTQAPGWPFQYAPASGPRGLRTLRELFKDADLENP
jgi:hypothetical protein